MRKNYAKTALVASAILVGGAALPVNATEYQYNSNENPEFGVLMTHGEQVSVEWQWYMSGKDTETLSRIRFYTDDVTDEELITGEAAAEKILADVGEGDVMPWLSAYQSVISVPVAGLHTKTNGKLAYNATVSDTDGSSRVLVGRVDFRPCLSSVGWSAETSYCTRMVDANGDWYYRAFDEDQRTQLRTQEIIETVTNTVTETVYETRTETVTETVEVPVEVPVEMPVEVVKTVTVEKTVPTEVEKLVYVNTGVKNTSEKDENISTVQTEQINSSETEVGGEIEVPLLAGPEDNSRAKKAAFWTVMPMLLGAALALAIVWWFLPVVFGRKKKEEK